MWPNSQFPAELVAFTEEILNRKLCAVLAISLTEKNFYLRILIDYSAIRYTGSAESPLLFKLHLNNKGVVDRCSMCKGTYLNMNVAYT